MSLEKMKTEMKGDTSRWTRRAAAKRSADRLRRAEDRRLVQEQLEDYGDPCCGACNWDGIDDAAQAAFWARA